MTASPLGRYSELAATAVALAVVAVWILTHAGIVTGDTSSIDTAFAIVIGVVLGQRVTTNGAAKIASAANRRLDAIGAPPADAVPPAAPPPPATPGPVA